MSSENSPAPATGDSIRRNAAFAFAGQMVTSLATGLLTLYLVRKLGPKDFGTLSIAIGLGTLVLLPGDFGISNSTARFVAEQRGDWPIVGGLLRHALRIKLVISSLLAVALFAAADLIASAYGTPGLAGPIRGIAIAIFFQGFMMLFAALFIALGRVSMNLRIISTEALVEAGAATALVIAGGGAAGAAFGRAIGYAAAAVLGLVLARRVIGARNLRMGEAPGGAKRIFGYAGALVIIDGAWALLSPIGTLLIGALLNARAVGLYAAPVRFITFLHYPGLSIASGIAPRLARTRDSEPDSGPLMSGMRWIMLIQSVLVAPTIVWAHPIVDILLGPGYGRSADVMAVLAPYTFLSGFAPLVSLSVNYLGEARRRVPIAVTTVLLSAALDLALIPTVGLLGAAIATDIAYAFYVFSHLWLCKQLIDMPLRPVARDLVRCAIAATVMAGAMALFGTSNLGPVAFIVGGAVGIAVYVGALLLLRAVTTEELAAARGAVARKFGRGRRPAPSAS